MCCEQRRNDRQTDTQTDTDYVDKIYIGCTVEQKQVQAYPNVFVVKVDKIFIHGNSCITVISMPVL